MRRMHQTNSFLQASESWYYKGRCLWITPIMTCSSAWQLSSMSESARSPTAKELKPGFVFDGERIPLINPQRFIFKP